MERTLLAHAFRPSRPDDPAREETPRPCKSTEELASSAQDVVLLWQRLARQGIQMWDHLQKDNGLRGLHTHITDPSPLLHMGERFREHCLTNPAALFSHQKALADQHKALWAQVMQRLRGEPAEPVVQPEPGDRRFRHETWCDNVFFDYLKQSYLLSARAVRQTARALYADQPAMCRKVDFYVRQWLDAVSPANFPWTNPEVIQAIMETGGQNLIRGLEQLCTDLEESGGRFFFSTRADHVFVPGQTMATTPGHVIFENSLFQLIQYAPSTPEVFRTPVLVIPPWIKKYYVFDMRPHNSWVKWLVDQGYTVFMVSWVNPDASCRTRTFEDYMMEGGLQALRVVSEVCHRAPVHIAGYCLGGTLLNCLLAFLAQTKDKTLPVATGTFMTTLTDFSHVGDFGILVEDAVLTHIEAHMAEKGYLDGTVLAAAFNMLRANDMIWSFVINSYLLAKQREPFDLLHWNADLMHMPEAMQRFLLRELYQNNRLVQPGGITMGGIPLDLRAIETPAYLLSTREDHIAPWESTYAATRLYKGPVRFVLSGSGHVAGVINPPSRVRYGYWTCPETPADPEEFLARAQTHEGSWWLDWLSWLGPTSGPKEPARIPGTGPCALLEPAPGRYALMQV